MTDYHELAKRKTTEPKVRFTPPDQLFAGADGVVNESATPTLFIGAELCNRFTIERYIESGAFGRGWVASDNQKADKAKVFLKTFRAFHDRAGPGDAEGHEKMIHKEVDVLMEAEAHRIPPHPNVVSGTLVYYGPVVVPKTGRTGEMFFCVSDDLCEGGELYNYLVFGNGIRKFPENIARYFFKQMADAVQHIHKHGMFHRDLKLENIVLDSHYNLKIMDFGHAKHASECASTVDAAGEKTYITQTFVGTSSYQPPELKSGMFYDPAAFDIWSLGVILFFLVGIEGLAAKGNDFTFMQRLRENKFKFNKSKNEVKLLDQVRSDKEVPDNAAFWEFFGPTLKFSPELKHMLNGIFDLQTKTRFSIEKVLAHPWLKGEMPTHAEVVACLSGRSSGIVQRNLSISIADKAPTQAAAIALVAETLGKIAPFRQQDNKFAVVIPPKFAVVVETPAKVSMIWLSGGLDEWLEFRTLVTGQFGITL